MLNEVHELIMIESYSVDDGLAELQERVAEIKAGDKPNERAGAIPAPPFKQIKSEEDGYE